MKKFFKDTNKLLALLAMGIVAILVLPGVVISTYTVLAGDDLSHSIAIGADHVGLFRYIGASFKYAGHVYKTWQGTYFAMFIQALLSPMNNFGYAQLHFVMFANAVLFWGALIWLAKTLMSKIECQSHLKIFVIALLVFSLTNYEAYEEVFFWFSGAASYSIPLSLMMIGFTATIRYADTHRIKWYVIAILCGIMAMGGSLTVSGTGCYVVALFVLYQMLPGEKKVSVRKLVPQLILFAVWFAGALINAAAPGNFVRYGYVDESGVHPIEACVNSVLMAGTRFGHFFTETNYVAVAILLILVGFLIGKRGPENAFVSKKYLFISLLALLTPIVTAFPLALGYSSVAMPNRCIFMVDVSLLAALANLAVVGGMMISGICEESDIKLFAVICVMMAACVVSFHPHPIENSAFAHEVKQLADGTYEHYCRACESFFVRLSRTEDSGDVRIPAGETPARIEYMYNLNLSDSPDYFVNAAIADYFGFDSFAIYW